VIGPGRGRPNSGRTTLAVVLAALALAAAACGPVTTGGAPSGSLNASSPAGPPVAPPGAALPLARKIGPPRAGAYLGVYAPPAPFVVAGVDAFESLAAKGVSIVMWYQPWAQDNRSSFDAGACQAIWSRGKVPMITWEPWDPGKDANLVTDPANQPVYRLSSIVDGRFDAYIRSWARGIREAGGPVMLRPMHEMNGDWYPWDGSVNGNTPEQFRAAWRHMHDLFAQEGATNVTWVWSINHESVPGTKANRYAAYYPGDEYVDWTAVSGFNWGTAGLGSRWHTFSFWYAAPLAYLATLGKPICIAEFASVEQGGSKAAWLLDAYARIRRDPRIKAVVYYDAVEKSANDAQDWRVGTSTASRDAFREAVASSYFRATPPIELAAWSASLTQGQKKLLEGVRPLY